MSSFICSPKHFNSLTKLKTKTMNQKQIISQLGFDANYWLAKKYAAKLVGLFSLINELEKLDGFKVCLNGIKGNLELVKGLPEINRINYKFNSQYDEAVRQQEYCRNLYGEFENWQQVTISHKTGSYKFPFPIGNKLYNVIASMAGEAIQETKKDYIVLNTLTVDSGIFATLSKAVKFISKDGLRPAMTCVCLDFENYKCEVVATDVGVEFKMETEIAALKADNERLREALKPFADMCEELTESKIQKGGIVFQYNDNTLTVSDFLKASTTLQNK